MIWKLLPLLAVLSLAACSTSPVPPSQAVEDAWTSKQMEDRRWRDKDELERDYIKLASESKIPVQDALVKVVGTSTDDAIRSLATKIHLIEQAEHSIDLTYYIFTPDLTGDAILGALCQAVKRGVDVRIMVDSLGSLSMEHGDLKGLIECAKQAGFVKTRAGEISTQQARVQAVVFNALTAAGGKANNRSHDKLLVIDGAIPEKAWVMTGGRNVSLHYYGLDEDGERDLHAFRDLEILVRPMADADIHSSPGQLTEYYFSVLFSKPGNKKLSTIFPYTERMQRSLDELARLKATPEFTERYQNIEEYLTEGFIETQTRFAHELDNLNADSSEVVSNYSANKLANVNSISGLLARMTIEEKGIKKVRIVSPYLFLQSDLLKDEGKIERELNVAEMWLAENPGSTIEVLTNSVLSSDNFFTQAVIDMSTVPTVLMSDEIREQWLDEDLSKNEENPEFLNSEAWQKLINHPRITFYQLGGPDADELGGSKHYGKLHAKFMLFDDGAFVGTTNFDYRSLLYNNEVGFFLKSEAFVEELEREFELLKSQSVRWGSEEWLEMRQLIREQGGRKGRTTEKQRRIFKRLHDTGLIYQF
ncbi:phospholipase D-like domain-containing protein [Agarivorans sp. Alg241-V36]|uniref:phospholipase D-like domain-containing protein n=1 Tax=Agarivorans sp. Alg241-V36 TaxID=2305992 RepID=UPI0013D22973|nr:phospholipase D-like domain-containing protein [Agarivorans sp. Alg241-V36]